MNINTRNLGAMDALCIDIQETLRAPTSVFGASGKPSFFTRLFGNFPKNNKKIIVQIFLFGHLASGGVFCLKLFIFLFSQRQQINNIIPQWILCASHCAHIVHLVCSPGACQYIFIIWKSLTSTGYLQNTETNKSQNICFEFDVNLLPH